jgi:hypothetical protein
VLLLLLFEHNSQIRVLLSKSNNIKVPEEFARWNKYRKRALRELPLQLIQPLRKSSITSYHDQIAKYDDDFQLYILFREEGFKDQYGESPKTDKYIQAPFSVIDDNVKNIYVIIDGGPRLEIVKYWINWQKINPTVRVKLFLLDASRQGYSAYLKQQSKGKFLSVKENVDISNKISINPDAIFNNKNPMRASSFEEAMVKELWFWDSTI